MISRREVLLAAGAASVAAAAPAVAGFEVEEKSLVELADALAQGRITSAGLVDLYLRRIEQLDTHGPTLRSIIEVNPEAKVLAKQLDDERAAKKARGPLHGVPILLKDNIDTADQMKTTAGSLAMLDAPTPKADAFVVQKLREAGALVLGKTNLSEWANLRGKNATSGWSARGGQTKNPYVLTRNPSGSSSGSAVAVAASLCAAAVGTETDGSITSPASNCGIVGFKPTVGLLSRSGVIPIAATQDTTGPMARSVRDAVLLLEGMLGVDPTDAAMAVKHAPLGPLLGALEAATLKGVRLGVVRELVDTHPRVADVMGTVLDQLKAAGATVVDIELSDRPFGSVEMDVLLFQQKAGLDAYLAARGGPMKSLADVIAFNTIHTAEELPHFGQQYFVASQAKGPLSSPAYKKMLGVCAKARQDLEAVHRSHRLDAVIAPTGSPAWLTDPVNGDAFGFSATSVAAVAGAPHLSVPMGFVGELPVGLSVIGLPWRDAKVLQLGHAFELATKARRAPKYVAG